MLTLPGLPQHLMPNESSWNVQGDDIINVAPKKANWDLRRDVAKGLEKLERRTKRALVAIMQEQQQPLDKDGAQ